MMTPDGSREVATELESALRWAIDGNRELPGLLTRDTLVTLAAVLEHRAGWSPPLLAALRIFLEVARRITPKPWPHVHPEPLGLADALAAFAPALTTATGSKGPAWRFEPTVDPVAMRALGQTTTATAIDAERGRNVEGWDEHARRAHTFILNALTNDGTVALLGAGRAYDLPVRELASRCDRLWLFDVDRAALTDVLATHVDQAARTRCEPRVLDLTGVGAQLVHRIDRAVRAAPSRPAAINACANLAASYQLREAPRFWPTDERVDLVVSCLVLSQLAASFERYVRRALARRFELDDVEAPELDAALFQLALRVQHDHVMALASHGKRVVLISDVWEEQLGEPMPLLGAYDLRSRVPRAWTLVAHERWTWSRITPRTPSEVGSRLLVQALTLEP